MNKKKLNVEEKYKAIFEKLVSDYADIKVKDKNNNESLLMDRGLLCIREICKNAIVFVGINPSNRIADKENGFYKKGINFYDLNKWEQASFYEKFKEIYDDSQAANKLIEWTYIDMLYYRETNQKYFKVLYANHENFINEQLAITKEIIEEIQPKMLVVCNTEARDQLKKMYDFEFDEEIGTHRIIPNNKTKLNAIPVFFTSMLSGQRALDNGSFERLMWHIKYALDKVYK